MKSHNIAKRYMKHMSFMHITHTNRLQKASSSSLKIIIIIISGTPVCSCARNAAQLIASEHDYKQLNRSTFMSRPKSATIFG